MKNRTNNQKNFAAVEKLLDTISELRRGVVKDIKFKDELLHEVELSDAVSEVLSKNHDSESLNIDALNGAVINTPYYLNQSQYSRAVGGIIPFVWLKKEAGIMSRRLAGAQNPHDQAPVLIKLGEKWIASEQGLEALTIRKMSTSFIDLYDRVITLRLRNRHLEVEIQSMAFQTAAQFLTRSTDPLSRAIGRLLRCRNKAPLNELAGIVLHNILNAGRQVSDEELGRINRVNFKPFYQKASRWYFGKSHIRFEYIER